jgi:hypothetical protein
MDAQDMLDVIHYMLEDDLNLISPEQAEARSKTRVLIYDSFYGKAFKYGLTARSTNRGMSKSFDLDGDEGFINNPNGGTIPFDPTKGPSGAQDEPPIIHKSKGYVPPTNFNPDEIQPFGKVLDSPMN